LSLHHFVLSQQAATPVGFWTNDSLLRPHSRKMMTLNFVLMCVAWRHKLMFPLCSIRILPR
jgi:hypothetical protein